MSHFPLSRTLSSDSIVSTSSSAAAKLVVQLIPASQQAGAFVKKQGLNSYLELTLPSNKTVASILKHLNQKWCSVDTSFSVRLQISPCGSPCHSLDTVLSSPPQHSCTTVQSIFDSLNLAASSKCVLHYTIFDPSAPPPPSRPPPLKRARSSPPAESKFKTPHQSKHTLLAAGTSSSSSSAGHSSTPLTAPKRKRSSSGAGAASSPTRANMNTSSSSALSSSAAAKAANHMSSRFPSPPRDIFGGGYGSGGTVGGSPNGAFVFDGDCDFQEAYNTYNALSQHGFMNSGEDSTQSHASGADVSAYLACSGAAAVAQLQQARTSTSTGTPHVVMRRVALDDPAAHPRSSLSAASDIAGGNVAANSQSDQPVSTLHPYGSSLPLQSSSTRSTFPWFNSSPSPMRFGAAALGSPVRFGAHSHSSPPLSFLPAPRPAAGGGTAALGHSQKSLPPFSLMDYGGDSRGSLGGLNWQAESSMWGGSSATGWEKQSGFGVSNFDTNSRSQLL